MPHLLVGVPVIGRQALGRVAVGAAVFLVAMSISVVVRGGETRVLGIDQLAPDNAPPGQGGPSPAPSTSPSAGAQGCDARADRRLRRAGIAVATTVRYAIGTGTRPVTDPATPGPAPFAVAYPAVAGGVSEAARRRINADIRRRTFAQIAAITGKQPKDGAAPPSATVQPSLDSAPDRLLGVRVELLSPGAKSAQPLVANYDLSTGARVSLHDLLPGGRDCQRPLCRAIGARLLETVGREQLLDPQEAQAAGGQPACPYLEQAAGGGFDALFMVEPDGLTLLFRPCQIVACAAGTTTVTIPFGTI
jgi:hypothetical protein